MTGGSAPDSGAPLSTSPPSPPMVSPTVPHRRRGVASSPAAPGTGEAVSLAVREYGARSEDASAHVLLLHGYPERQDVWVPVVAHLLERDPDLHVITYDYRGAGESTRPTSTAAYVVDLLVDDLVAVLDATCGDTAVHLVGHDWGSVQLWEAIAAEATGDPRLAGRIASYTSVSGPPLDHLADLARGRVGSWRTRVSQLVHSWYVYAFLVPGLAEAALSPRAVALGSAHAHRLDPTLTDLTRAEHLSSDARHAVRLYRANVVGGMRRPKAWVSGVPTQVVVLERDGFVTPGSLADLERRCPDLVRQHLDVGHFLIPTHGDRLAELVLDHVHDAGARSA
ncbi:alpha/beta fold hydrolase [Nocardioides massiliensis]|uniref:Pimeloyl-ACP methyl ester carboxylesterase n=1 Tax=Nocardioides massiliensis TaxID=1325935 RepID=A0ABT9NP52_9ACTN|nr:alpha/beta fold hydrolase [Nocardioides massiliensis]MDP9822178.1 pimeloyl-ACP methyl ester carboxylesterase [Nocardioides massiliensis]